MPRPDVSSSGSSLGDRQLAAVLGAVAIVLGAGLGAALLLGGNGPLAIDEAWMRTLLALRSPELTAVARAVDFIGGGWFAIVVVPLGVAAAFLAARRPWAALAFVVASAASAGLVQLLKAAYARPRPEDILVVVDPGSFPSGHTANAATIAVLLGLLLARRWPVWAAGAAYVLLMALTRTYLAAHWASDTLGGALLGAGAGAIAWAVLAGPDRRHARRRAGVPPGRAASRHTP